MFGILAFVTANRKKNSSGGAGNNQEGFMEVFGEEKTIQKPKEILKTVEFSVV